MKTKIFILALIYLLLLRSAFSAEEKALGQSWPGLFTEPFEMVYVIMKDGATFPCTSRHETMVDMSIGRLKEELKKRDFSMKDIAVVIHNHRMKKTFGQEDWRQYHLLKRYGFNGRFLLYCHRTKEVYDIEDKKKSAKTPD